MVDQVFVFFVRRVLASFGGGGDLSGSIISQTWSSDGFGLF